MPHLFGSLENITHLIKMVPRHFKVLARVAGPTPKDGWACTEDLLLLQFLECHSLSDDLIFPRALTVLIYLISGVT